jgi:hypothetical protein
MSENTEEATQEQEAKLPQVGHLCQRGMLDFRSAKTPADLEGITLISEVGCILIPEHLVSVLNKIPMKNVGGIISLPEGENPNLIVQTGQINLSGEALAAGDPEKTLFVIGQVHIRPPVTSIGYKEIWIHGQMMAPRESQGIISSKLTRMDGQTLYLPAEARIFMGDETLEREFLELLPKPQCIVMMGCLTVKEDVTVELLREKVPEIVLMGEILAPAHLIPILKVLTVEKMGEIKPIV